MSAGFQEIEQFGHNLHMSRTCPGMSTRTKGGNCLTTDWSMDRSIHLSTYVYPIFGMGVFKTSWHLPARILLNKNWMISYGNKAISHIYFRLNRHWNIGTACVASFGRSILDMQKNDLTSS